MRLNYYLPQYDFVEKHSIIVNSKPEKSFEAIWHIDMADSKAIKTLFIIFPF